MLLGLTVSHFNLVLLLTKHLIIVSCGQRPGFSNNQVECRAPGVGERLRVCVCEFARAAVTKEHARGSFNNGDLFSDGSGGQKSETKVSEGLAPSPLSLACCGESSACDRSGPSLCVQISSTSLTGWAPIQRTSFPLHCLC